MQTIKYQDIQTASDGQRRLSGEGSGISGITLNNALSAFVLNGGANNYVAVFFTYNDFLYVAVKNLNNMAGVSGTFTVRVFYFN